MRFNIRFFKTAALLLGSVLGGSKTTEALVWWPEAASVSPEMTIYQDYDDKNSFYYVPKQVGIAINHETGVPMVNHGLFFDRLKPQESTTLYNMTLEPKLRTSEVNAAAIALRSKYGASARLSPLPITTVSFSVTMKNERDEIRQVSSPFSVSVPKWTGDLHSFHQRFSISMLASLFRAEPAMSDFMTNAPSNAFVGTLHYGFKGIRRVFDGSMQVNIRQLHSKLSTHLSASGLFASVDIKAAFEKIKDDQSVFVEVKKDAGYESQVWTALVDKLMKRVFESVPVLPSTPDGSPRGGKLYSFRADYQNITDDRILSIDLKESVIEDHGGDVDIVGGAMKVESLDPNIKYVCHYWARYSRDLDRCEKVCEVDQRWDSKTKTCESIMTP